MLTRPYMSLEVLLIILHVSLIEITILKFNIFFGRLTNILMFYLKRSQMVSFSWALSLWEDPFFDTFCSLVSAYYTVGCRLFLSFASTKKKKQSYIKKLNYPKSMTIFLAKKGSMNSKSCIYKKRNTYNCMYVCGLQI